MPRTVTQAHDERSPEQSPRLSVCSSRLRQPNARLESTGLRPAIQPRTLLAGMAIAEGDAMLNQYIVLALGLNIRAQNRITMEEQQAALRPIADDLEVRMVGDKGTYLVTSRHTADHVRDLILDALRTYRPGLSVRGASVVVPALVEVALGELARVLMSRYGSNFDVENHGIKLGPDTWRAGFAVPLFPGNLPPERSLFTEKWKNAKVFGWCPGAVLVAKREAPGVHWGTTVTGPASRVVRDEGGVSLEFSSRSANILRDLLG